MCFFDQGSETRVVSEFHMLLTHENTHEMLAMLYFSLSDLLLVSNKAESAQL